MKFSLGMRTEVTVIKVMQSLAAGLTPAQLDDLFRLADTL